MNTLQQVIKQRRDEFEEEFKYPLYSLVKRDGIDIYGSYAENANISSHNLQTVVTILEAVKKEIGEDEEITDRYQKGIPINIGISMEFLRGMNSERNRTRSIIDSTLQNIKNNNEKL